MPGDPLIRNISDTARWAAVFRAVEADRPNPLFRDPLARRLAGDRGNQIAENMPDGMKHAWSWIVRTYLFDQFIVDHLEKGFDQVVNLAAGLDARPYRMTLPSSLRWVEVDLPEILAYKEEVLAKERPVCSLERIRLDLTDGDARRAVFNDLAAKSKKTLVVTEGLIIYLTEDGVSSLARDLSAAPSFQRWVIDLASPGLLRILKKNMDADLKDANAVFKFAPAAGPDFFKPLGWSPVDVRPMLHSAARLKRLSFFMRLLAKIAPEAYRPPGKQPWGGVILLDRE